MPATRVSKRRVEFGDFQTPQPLADAVCRLLKSQHVAPAAIVEPTCGTGTILVAAIRHFPKARQVLGVEINADHAAKAEEVVGSLFNSPRTEILQTDFFTMDWPPAFAGLPQPILVVGNPPWVTNAALGTLASHNLPAKSNSHGRSGLDALTGKSNFDISEWMISHIIDWLNGATATVAMLCKTSVARKVLKRAWETGVTLRKSAIYRIDAATQFEAAVDACLLVCSLSAGGSATDCAVYESIESLTAISTWGFHDGALVADVAAYRRHHGLRGVSQYRWRSGVKHDCARVMELIETADGLRNGLGESVQVEGTYRFPLLKSSELARGGTPIPARQVLVTQREASDDTSLIEQQATATWSYLMQHADRLDKRASSVYRRRPRFCVFGVGSYSFASWKVAISGFYKSLRFCLVPPHTDRPTMLDDTAYFLPCQTAQEMHFLHELLLSQPAQEFLSAFIFWDAKRPITAEILGQLDLAALANQLGRGSEFQQFAAQNPWAKPPPA